MFDVAEKLGKVWFTGNKKKHLKKKFLSLKATQITNDQNLVSRNFTG
jgi:hypothetical protein